MTAAVPMPQRFAIPVNSADFEQMCLALLRRHWSRPGLESFAKRGEGQFGIDILDISGEPQIYAAQCKLREPHKSLSPAEIQAEVNAAIRFDPPLARYAVLTTGKVSARSQRKIQEINRLHRADGLFEVELLPWEKLCELLQEYPEVRERFYGAVKEVASAPAVHDTLTIVIPVFNESRTLRDLARALRAEQLINRYRIILCDDGSTDDSFAVMQRCFDGIPTVTCVRNQFNSRKVGAIHKMATMAETPFILTLDADSVLSEQREGAIDALIDAMNIGSYDAAYFRIVPAETDWLGSLQRLDYTIFTDALRRFLGVPLCLIGQGVLWRKASLLNVLTAHSGNFDGDDLENTVIALSQKMKLYWERETLFLVTRPKRTIRGLVRQRALSWDFGMFRVLCDGRVIRIAGESGAFYKNILLLDLLAHPFKLMAIPVLFSVVIFGLAGQSFREGAAYDVYTYCVAASFRYGSLAIFTIWLASVVNSAVCVRGNLLSTFKWAAFNAVYLSSPFVYLMYYRLVSAAGASAYDLLGSAVYWLASGLLLTYLWWLIITIALVMCSSLDTRKKAALFRPALLAPLYFLVLLTVCRTMGIWKYLKQCVLARLFRGD